MIIMNVFTLQPSNKMWEIVRDFLADKYPVYHMAAEQPHLYLVTQMGFNFFIFMDAFEYM